MYGKGDLDFLKRSFAKLMLNFSWWVNRKDRTGKNLFEGGFLGLDNIGVFDRSSPLPTGGFLEQADGTAWVSLFSQNMLEMAVELAANDSDYEDMALKFAEHFLWIAHAMNQMGSDGMWDEEDGFYYDVLRLPDGSARGSRFAPWWGCCPYVRPLWLRPWQRERVPRVAKILSELLKRSAGTDHKHSCNRTGSFGVRRARHHWAGESGIGCAGFCHGCWTRTNFSVLTVSGRFRKYHDESFMLFM